MRPAGEISLAIEQAVEQLWTPERSPTLAEIAAPFMASAPVPFNAIRNTVPKMKRYGRLVICGQRKVPRRNRPAAEYALPHQVHAANEADFVGLSQAMQLWG